jgi:hypothetical protein
MTPEGLILCFQEPATGPYPEPDESSPHYHILFYWDSFLILTSFLRVGLKCGLFLSGFTMKITYTPSQVSVQHT